MKTPLFCFAIVLLGLWGIEWNKKTDVSESASRVLINDLFGTDQNKKG